MKYKHLTGRGGGGLEEWAYLRCTSFAEEIPFYFRPEWQHVLLDRMVKLKFS
jgi:hypothetical protein